MKSVPRTVWALGAVSLCMDLSSEMVHGLLPLFLTSVLGASMVAVGFLEGIAEATAAMMKVFSGALSDRFTRRKPLVLLGYACAALSKPLFPLAESVAMVLGARFMDRVGKGIRGAPRDALIADVTPPSLRGTAYGLRQMLDTAGAVLGPLAAVGLMFAFAEDIRSVLWVAVLPALAAVTVLVIFVREPGRRRSAHREDDAISGSALSRLGGRYWTVVGLGAVLTLARFSEAFLILRAQELGVALALAPLVFVLMNVAYTAVSYPAGVAADHGHRRALLISGLASLILADVVIGMSASVAALVGGVVLWGTHMGLTQGLLSTLVADAAPEEARGTAFGVFHLVTGASLLAASVLAGWLWSTFGARAAFLAGAAFCTVALIGLLATSRPASRHETG